jgi:hypothetical protein
MLALILDLFVEKISFEHQLNLNEMHSKLKIDSLFVLLHQKLFRWAVVLAFDVKIERDAQDHADSVGMFNSYLCAYKSIFNLIILK